MRELIDGSTGDHRRDGSLMTEHVLGGGNVAAGVVRVGDTVRKPAGFWTPAVDALLTHLRQAGFTGAPQRHASRTTA